MLQSFFNPRLSVYEGTKPNFDLQDYFNGPIKAWGIVQNFRGEVVRNFAVDMVGTWDADVGTLREVFAYDDGEEQKRTWTIRRLHAGAYEGKAEDILGSAQGRVKGRAMRWTYAMDVPVGETTYRLQFDDWMFMMGDGILVNRSYLKKFGITVAELTLFMQKQPQK